MNFWGFTPFIFQILESSFYRFLEKENLDDSQEFYLPQAILKMSATKKQIFLDVDGVLLNFHKSFAWFLEERYSFKSNNTEIAHSDSLIKHAEKNAKFSELAEKLKDRTVIYDFWASKYFSILESLVDISSYNQVAEKYPIYLVSNLPNISKKI